MGSWPGPTPGPDGPRRRRRPRLALPVRPLLLPRAHTKKAPEERSLRLRRFLVQVRRKLKAGAPRDGGSRRAPSPPHGSQPVPHLLRRRRFSSSARGRVGILQQSGSRTLRRFGSFFKRRSSLVNVDAATASRRHRCHSSCLTPPTEGTARGRDAEDEGALLFRVRFGSFRRGPSARPSHFGALLCLRLLPQGAEEDWEAPERPALPEGERVGKRKRKGKDGVMQ